MSYVQWIKYEEQLQKEREIDLRNQTKKNLYNDEDSSWHFKSSTRQVCNVVFENDNFLKISGKNEKVRKEKEKLKSYESMIKNGNFSYDDNLKYYSPKSYQILTNSKIY